MMTDNLKRKTVSGLIWSFVENFSLKASQFILGIIMARYLLPEDFGLIAMLSIFISISQIFIDGGFSAALIQKQDRTDLDYSTIYYFNLIVSIVVYLILFYCAPAIASFYKMPELINLTRIISLNLIISSTSAVAKTKLTIDIDFKTQAKASTISVILSGIVGIYLAVNDYGVWALVTQSILYSTLQSILILYLARWFPMFGFSISSFKSLVPFGSRLMVAKLISAIYNDIYALYLGKKFSSADLGFYSRAELFTRFPTENISAVISRVTFPILSSISNEDERLELVYIKYLKLTAFLVFPIMFLAAAIANPLIEILLTDNWLKTVPILQVLCLGYMWEPIGFLNLNLLYVKGESKLILRLEIIKKLIGFFILLVSAPFGLTSIVIGRALYSLVSFYINTYYTGKHIKLDFFAQLRIIMPQFILSLSLGILVYVVTLTITGLSYQLFIGMLVGAGYYVFMSYILKFESFLGIIDVLKKRIFVK